jgi:NADH-quinone oxidoreductase subunit F
MADKIASPKELEKRRNAVLKSRDPDKTCVTICLGTGCSASGGREVALEFHSQMEKAGLTDKVDFLTTGCHGFCERGPIVVIRPENIFYANVKTGDVAEIIEKTLKKGEIIDRLLYVDPETKEKIIKEEEVSFYLRQKRLVLSDNGYLDPRNLDDYLAVGGFKGLAKALTEMKPDAVVKEVIESGLRGRGGGGFPAGKKWELCRSQESDTKYIICNADEGDPGAFMDRSLLEGNPCRIIEGLTIGGFAIGANVAYVYVRHEYPLAVDNLEIALENCREAGLLGENILGSGFDFDIKINRGGGAFVCGEETALIASIEGNRGTPRPRPPYPVVQGLFGQPTVINNVETWANVPLIIENGAKWFAGIGSEGSKGTKVFSLVGNVNNTGLVEVPMGIALWDIVFGIGGGIPGGRSFKGVQTGGPSGGCIPGNMLNLPVDFDELAKAGSMMGSGGMVVMDEHTCMVDTAKYFLEFCRDESCGKCTPCREGIPRLIEILERITKGEGEMEDLGLLEELGEFIKETSLCGLGQTAPNPLLTTMNYYRDEYEAHIKYKKCPGGVCKDIISSPCHHVCPVGMDAAGYIAYIADGKPNKALEVIYNASPLAGICGRVCHHPCEFMCTSGDAGEPISIRALKRYASEKGRNGYKPPVGPSKGKKVAVIGSGPAGLTCAWDLALKGYKVTVFESLPVAGGMLYAGIPEYRLPRDVLNQEIDMIRKAGVDIKTNTKVGTDVQFDDLKRDYDAVFVATGAHKGLKLNIEGEEALGVQDSVEFLREFNIDGKAEVGKKVGVIGGGNAAIDAARTALRAGADEVTILYRRTKTEMPADEIEIEAAIEEGIKIEFLVAPTKVIAEDGRITALECIRMELGEVDRGGRRRPVPKEGTEFTVELDNLFPAISQEPDITYLPDSNGFGISKWNSIEVDEETLYTGVEGVFAGGDVVTGPWTVTDAMGHGKLAARSIHKYLSGEDLTPEYKVTESTVDVKPYEMTAEEVEKLVSRPEMPCIKVADRIKTTEEVDLVLSDTDAINEAKRCLRCDWRLESEEN